MKKFIVLLLIIPLAINHADAQILKKLGKVKDKITGITVDKLSRDPITTSFKDVNKRNIQPETLGANANYKNLHDQPFDPEIGFTLQPGYYEAELMSFCIKAGTYMPTKGSGRFYAEMKGPKADIFETILKAVHTDRSLERMEVQVLLWAIIAKTDFQKMKGPIKATALKILSAQQIARLSKGALDKIARDKLKGLAYKNDALKAILEAENNLRSKFYAGVKDLSEYEEVAVLAGLEPVVTGYEAGKWSKHPEGYYLRYYPSGYKMTKTQIYVPKTRGTVSFNAFGDVAVPASTGAQRLLQTNIPWGDRDWGYGNPTRDDIPDTETPTTSETQELTCDQITADTVWSNGPGDVDYIVPDGCVIDVTASLTIEAGTVIKFGKDAGLGVYDGGSIQALGTATNRILMGGTTSFPGHWRGIHLEGDGDKVFEYTTFSSAGSNYVYCCNKKGVFNIKSGSATIKNSKISGNDGEGMCVIHVGSEATLIESGNVINGEICYGDPEKLPRQINTPTVLRNTPREVDYIVDDGMVVDVTASLTIEPGVVIKFGKDAGLGVYDGGSIYAVGTATQRIGMYGAERSPGPGYWRGIHLEGDGDKVFEYTAFSGAGSNYVYCCNKKGVFNIKSGSATIKNSNIGGNDGEGMCVIHVGSETTLIESGNVINGEICYGDPEKLPRQITTPTVLRNTHKEVDYVVDDGMVVDVTASLTIEPGVVIEFGEDAGLGVYDGGSIYAVGTATQKIIMRGVERTSGYWRGIHLEGDGDKIFDYVNFLNTGSNYTYCCNEKAAVLIKNETATIRNSLISGSSGCGVFIKSGAILNENYNIFSGNRDGDICYGEPQKLPEKIEVSTILKNTPNDVDYFVDANIVVNVTASLTIEPGVVIEFGEDAGLGVYDTGSINAIGTATQKIVMRGVERTAGYWRGIHLESNENQIEYLSISDAGSKYVYCCNEKASLFLKSGASLLTFKNITISNGKHYGIYVGSDVVIEQFSNISIRSHDDYPIAATADNLKWLKSEINTNQMPTLKNFIYILDGDVSSPTTWHNQDIPYLVANFVIDVTSLLTIEPGVVIEFGNDAGLGIYDDGKLIVQGTATERVILRGKVALPGKWRGIHLETNDNSITHATIQHAGSNYVYCCNEKAAILVKAGSLQINNSHVSDNNGCGILIKSTATLTETGNTFSNNNDGHICN